MGFLKFSLYFLVKLYSFLDLCLQKNPNKRASTTELLEHDFLKGVDDFSCKVEIQEIIKKKKAEKENSQRSDISEEEKHEEVFV